MKKSRNLLKRTRWAIALGVLAIAVGLTVLAGAGALIGFEAWSENAVVDATLLPTASALPVFLDADGNQIPYKTDNYMSPDEIPKNVKAAFIALEDKRFYNHDGFDTRRMASATLKNLSTGSAREGASTITQQLVKNTHLTAQKTIRRKLNEIAIARKIEELYTKDEILSMYLSVIYYGGGAYGIKSASRLYFDKTPDELTTAECATLAGIVKNPTGYSPKNNINASKERRNLVLSVMEREGYISAVQAEAAKNEKLTLASNTEQTKENSSKFYLERVILEVTEKLNITRYQLNNSGLTVMTNLDSSLQQSLVAQAESGATYATAGTESEAVVIENSTGRVLAHHSTLGYEVTRQAGSTLKPLVVYAPALENNVISLATPIVDELTDFGGWSPKNFKDIYYGDTTPREALKKSMNTVAAKIATYIGTDKMLEYGRKFGLVLYTSDNSLPLSLGATEKGNSPLSIAGGYTTLANSGTYIEPTYVNAVVRDGVKIYSAAPKSNNVISAETAYLTTSMLLDTVADGTAKSLSVLPFQVAAKTGTVGAESNTDAWCVGYTTAHTVAIWHGASSMIETGGGHPTRHARVLFEKLYASSTDYPVNFKMNENVIALSVDTYSTKKNRIVTLANDDTPEKFKQKELFDMRYLPSAENSAFDKASVDFSLIAMNLGDVKIELSTEEIYNYEIMRKDVFGEKLILSVSGSSATDNKVLVVSDRPFSLGRPVTYTVKIYLENGKQVGESSMSVIPKYSFD